MTITVNSTCDEITIASSILIASNQEVTLIATHNCTTEYEFTYASTDIPIVLTSADFNSITTIADGVWGFELTIVNVSSSIITETKCTFVNCTSTCAMLPLYKDVQNTESLIKVLSFEALLLASDCTDCSCTDMCELYNNTGLNDDPNVGDCGCD